MKKLRIDLDDENKRNRIIWWYIGTIIISLVPSLPSLIKINQHYQKFYTFSFANQFFAHEYVHLVAAITSTTYFVLINALHGRFEILASLLR